MFLQTNTQFKTFFHSFYPVLVHFCQRYVGDPEGAKDIAQETFMRLHEKTADFDNEMKVRGFMYETAKNLCYDVLKHRSVQEKYIHYQECHTDAEDALSLEIIREEAFSVLYKAISQLPLQSRRIIEACLEGHSNREIAGLLGIAETTVKTLRQLAYRKLRESLPRHVFVLFFHILMNKNQ